MIDKELLKKTVEEAIADTDLFVVDIDVRPGNDIVVEVDSMGDVDIDQCAAITRKIESVFDRDVEDYSLEVGSAGFTSPFRVVKQYEKNVGNDVEVLTSDGRKLVGKLTGVDAQAGTFDIEVPTKVKAPGAKRPTIEQVPYTLDIDQCKQVRYHFVFK